MKKALFLLLALLPFTVWAHDLPVPHNHDGILNGWESITLVVLAVLVISWIVKSRIKLKSHEEKS